MVEKISNTSEKFYKNNNKTAHNGIQSKNNKQNQRIHTDQKRALDKWMRKLLKTKRKVLQQQQQDSSWYRTMIINQWPKWQTKPKNSLKSTKYNQNNIGTKVKTVVSNQEWWK